MTGSPFVDRLYRLNAQDTRARLVAVRAAVHARIDELTDIDLKTALMSVSDSVDRLLLETSRVAVERLANGLDDSHLPAGTAPVRPARPGPRLTPKLPSKP